MAGLKFSAGPSVGEMAAGASLTTLLMVVAPANQRVKVTEIGVYFDGVSAVTQAVIVELYRATSTGTMSATEAVLVDSGMGETIQSTVTYLATVEPTRGDVVEAKNVHPQSGYEKAYGLGEEVWIPGGTRMAIAITPAAAVNAIAYMKCEE